MTANPCADCGACCRATPGRPLFRATLDDIAREPLLMTFVGLDGSAPAGVDCPFLGPDRLCTIYETRPQMCRDYPVGGELCGLRRQAVGLIPLPTI